MRLQLTLNAQERTFEIEGDEPLLDVLRADGLTSVRLSCGIGLCGACTVLVDGEPISSCLLHAGLAEGRAVTTVEGLAEDDPVLRAFDEAGAFQCGYCTPGMVLSAKALAAVEPHAQAGAIRHWMNGNLCRCGSYRRIEQAITTYLEEVSGAGLGTYDLGPGTPARVGVLRGDDVIDGGFAGDMTALIAGGDLAAPSAALQVGGPVAGARLRAPLRPRTLRDFLTFEGHTKAAMKALGREVPELWYEVPAYYKGLPDTVIGPEDVIPWPRYTDKLDYELEIAAVIGAEGSDIAKADARAHIFGWTIWNDMSARDTQTRELPLGMGPSKAKDWDGSNILGPCIATADELDGFDAEMILRVNGEERTRARSSQMHHSFADLIAYASQDTVLRPGEVIGSGTAPGGAGVESGTFLSAGDVIEMEIPGIGVLRNRVGAKPA